MVINTNIINRNLVVTIEGDIDHHTTKDIVNKLDKDIARNNIKNVLFDFSHVQFMDSSGIGMVIGRYKMIEKQGGNVAVCNLRGNFKTLFDLSGLKKILKTYETYDEAIEALGGK